MDNSRVDRRVNFAFEKILKKGKVRKCLLAGEKCSGAAIDSHSIQNSAVLERLAEDGHVFTLRATMDNFGPKLKYTGRNIASTFPGFCSYHDTQIFRDIDFSSENIPTSFTPKQMVLFFLRTVSIEGWKKQSIINSFEDLAPALKQDDFSKASQILGVPEQFVRDAVKNPKALEWSLRGHIKGLDDMQRMMGSLLWQINQEKFHGTINHHWMLNSTSNIAVVSGMSPLWDIKGNMLYGGLPSSADGKMCHAGLTIFEANGKTNIIVSYLKKDHSILAPLFSQIDELAAVESRMKKWMTEFILENCENVVFRPSFINELSTQQKDELEKAAAWNLMYQTPPKKDFSFCFFN